MKETSGVASSEVNLTILKIIDTFTFYGIDVVLLAALTAVTVQIFKLTFLKNFKKKLLTFLPFIVGTAYYAVYAGLVNWSVSYVINEYADVLEHGVSVGAVATLTYVLYEQFVREKSPTSATEGVIFDPYRGVRSHGQCGVGRKGNRRGNRARRDGQRREPRGGNFKRERHRRNFRARRATFV